MGEAQTAQLVATLQLTGQADRRRRVPSSRFPVLVETEYGSRLAALVRRIAAVYRPLIERMPALLAGVEATLTVRTDSMESEAARRLLEDLYNQTQRDLRAEGVEALARLAGERTSQAQRRVLAQQIKAGLGVDVPIDESRTRDVLSYFATENATLITGIPEQMHERIAALSMRALSKRMKPETYAAELQQIVDVSEGRARQIARDQIGSLNARLTEVRQLELGVTHYIWETRRDEKVRQAHRVREGKRFPWSRPPAGGHPGDDYGCRCGAKPDLSGVLKAVESRHGVVRPL